MPKKGGKGKKGKKKKVAGPIGMPLLPPALFEYLQKEYESLEKELLVLSMEADEIAKRTREDRMAMREMEKELIQAQHATFAITSDAARGYKQIQEMRINKINKMETLLTGQREEMDIRTHEWQEIAREKDDEIKLKDTAIEELKQRMDNVANEFADMLTETLTILKRKLDATIEELREDELNYNESKRRDNKHFIEKLKEFNIELFE